MHLGYILACLLNCASPTRPAPRIRRSYHRVPPAWRRVWAETVRFLSTDADGFAGRTRENVSRPVYHTEHPLHRASQRTSHVYPPTCCRNLSVYEIITITISMIMHHSVHVYPPINHTKPSRRMLETKTKALRPRPLLWPRDRRRPTFRPTDWSRDQTHGLGTEPIRLVSRLWLICLPRAIIMK